MLRVRRRRAQSARSAFFRFAAALEPVEDLVSEVPLHQRARDGGAPLQRERVLRECVRREKRRGDRDDRDVPARRGVEPGGVLLRQRSAHVLLAIREDHHEPRGEPAQGDHREEQAARAPPGVPGEVRPRQARDARQRSEEPTLPRRRRRRRFFSSIVIAIVVVQGPRRRVVSVPRRGLRGGRVAPRGAATRAKRPADRAGGHGEPGAPPRTGHRRSCERRNVGRDEKCIHHPRNATVDV